MSEVPPDSAQSRTILLPLSLPAGAMQLFQAWLLLGDIYDGIIERPASLSPEMVRMEVRSASAIQNGLHKISVPHPYL